MKKQIIQCVLLLEALLLLGLKTPAAGQSSARGVVIPPNYDTFQPPPVGSSYVDPVFGSTVKRISNALATPNAAQGGYLTWIADEYSTMSPFNSDNSKILLVHQSYFGLYDGTGFYIRDLPLEINSSSEPRWSRRDNHTIYYIHSNQIKTYDISSGVSLIVHTFSEYSAISGMGKSDISYDGDHFVFAGDRRYVFVYQISTGTKSPVFDTGGAGFDSIYITPRNNVIISWLQSGTGRNTGQELFDGNMNFLRQVGHADGHKDVTLDTNGDEVLVWTNSNDPQPICNNGIVKIRLADGTQTCLAMLDWSLAVHISAPDSAGFVYVETYAPSNPSPSTSGWVAYTNELLQIKLDGSQVLRLAHHRSRPYQANTYNWQPKMSTSRDGSRVVYTSDYDLQLILGYATQYGDTYLILVGNLSLNKPATQSSTYAAPWAAGKAVDGTTDGVFNNAASSSTNFDANAWWQVDLGSTATVSSVVVWNRTDCCQNRLGDYWIFISDTPFRPSDTPATLQNRAGTWNNHQTAAPNPTTAIPVPSAIGRYVRVQLSGTDYLTLAEVQVIGVIGGGSGGPDLTIVKTHTGNFAQGQNGATYNITVSSIGTAATNRSTTNGTVTVTESIPPGLTLVSMSGNGWTCPSGGITCTRFDALLGGASYPAITVTVNVAENAPSQVINQVNVSGGGSASATALDLTIITSLVPPTNVSVTPSSGGGSSQVFTATYSDAQGYPDISQALFMVAGNASGVAGCFAMWVPASNSFYLGNDAATTWLGPIQGGSSSTLQNSQCVLGGATSSGSGAGTNLTVNFGLSFKGGFTGAKNTYQLVSGSAGNSGWQQKGTWTPSTPQAPTNVSVTPSSGGGSSQVFTATYSDAQGYQDITQALFMVAGNASGVAGCFAMWVPASNSFYLGNDAATTWLGPIQGGSSSTLQNSQCVLGGATSSGSGAGTNLTVNFGLSFKGGFTGAKNTYQLVSGSAGNSGWQQKGTWTPSTPQAPTNVSVTPSSGGGSSQVFTATYSDAQGYQDITQALFMVAGNDSGVAGCFAMWVPASNSFYLGNDAATTWLGPIQGGSSSTLQNSQCVLGGATSSGSGVGTNLTVNFGLSFKGGFTGAKNTYQLVSGSAGNSGWQQKGSWIP